MCSAPTPGCRLEAAVRTVGERAPGRRQCQVWNRNSCMPVEHCPRAVWITLWATPGRACSTVASTGISGELINSSPSFRFHGRCVAPGHESFDRVTFRFEPNVHLSTQKASQPGVLPNSPAPVRRTAALIPLRLAVGSGRALGATRPTRACVNGPNVHPAPSRRHRGHRTRSGLLPSARTAMWRARGCLP